VSHGKNNCLWYRIKSFLVGRYPKPWYCDRHWEGSGRTMASEFRYWKRSTWGCPSGQLHCTFSSSCVLLGWFLNLSTGMLRMGIREVSQEKVTLEFCCLLETSCRTGLVLSLFIGIQTLIYLESWKPQGHVSKLSDRSSNTCAEAVVLIAGKAIQVI